MERVVPFAPHRLRRNEVGLEWIHEDVGIDIGVGPGGARSLDGTSAPRPGTVRHGPSAVVSNAPGLPDERWFRDLTDPNPRRGIFASVPDLIASIETYYLEATNDDPKPYVWTATAETILAKVHRARTKLEGIDQN